MTSAVKVDGERLYKKAHRGEVVETPVKQVEITAIDVLGFDEEEQTLRCRIACSKGTYVRQLAIDIGEAVGRRRLPARALAHGRRPAEAGARADAGRLRAGGGGRRRRGRRRPGLLSPARALSFLPAVEVSAVQAAGVRNGARLPGAHAGAVCLTYPRRAAGHLRHRRVGPRAQARRHLLSAGVELHTSLDDAGPTAAGGGHRHLRRRPHRPPAGRRARRCEAAQRGGPHQHRAHLRPSPHGGDRPGPPAAPAHAGQGEGRPARRPAAGRAGRAAVHPELAAETRRRVLPHGRRGSPARARSSWWAPTSPSAPAAPARRRPWHAAGAKLGFRTVALPLATAGGGPISSTRIRRLLQSRRPRGGARDPRPPAEHARRRGARPAPRPHAGRAYGQPGGGGGHDLPGPRRLRRPGAGRRPLVPGGRQRRPQPDLPQPRRRGRGGAHRGVPAGLQRRHLRPRDPRGLPAQDPRRGSLRRRRRASSPRCRTTSASATADAAPIPAFAEVGLSVDAPRRAGSHARRLRAARRAGLPTPTPVVLYPATVSRFRAADPVLGFRIIPQGR